MTQSQQDIINDTGGATLARSTPPANTRNTLYGGDLSW